jgi:hypothetical protein
MAAYTAVNAALTMPTLSDIVESDRPDYRGVKGPASIRYNNPGAMWPGPSSRKFGAIGGRALNDGLGQGNKIAIFDDAVDGASALFDLWDRVYTGKTLRQAITKWSGGNLVDSYLTILRQEAGLSPDLVVTRAMMRDPDFAIKLAKAMAKHEAGRDYPLTDDQWRVAHAEWLSPIPTQAQSRSQEEGRQAVQEAARNSTTILGSIIAMTMTVAGWFADNVASIVKFAGESVAVMTSFSPVQTIAANVAGNIQGLTFGLTLAAIAYVISRRLKAAKEGKIG